MDHSTVFISYTRNDKETKEKLIDHLSALKWTDTNMNVFIDGYLKAGDKWEETIFKEIQKADMFVLLVSKKFLTSSFIQNKELPAILERHRKTKARIIPIILESCMWQETRLGSFLARPEDGKPLSQYPSLEKDDILLQIAREVNRLYFEQVAVDKIRVLVADDHEYAVVGLSNIIADTDDMIVVAECRSPHEVEQQTEALNPDVILLDMAWFRDDTVGKKIIENVKSISSKTKIIAISNYPNLLEEAERLGAYPLDKGFTIITLLYCIRNVASGVLNSEPISRNLLTDRENEVLIILADGYSDKEIAKRLN
ncbi:MAG: TIR domain-containing protein, partial [Chloroflexota bacterium]